MAYCIDEITVKEILLASKYLIAPAKKEEWVEHVKACHNNERYLRHLLFSIETMRRLEYSQKLAQQYLDTLKLNLVDEMSVMDNVLRFSKQKSDTFFLGVMRKSGLKVSYEFSRWVELEENGKRQPPVVTKND